MEIPLCPYDSCRLLSINLYNFVDNPFTDKASFNWEKFNHVSKIAQKLMDDIVDLEEEKINAILSKIDKDPESEEIKAVERNLWLKIRKKLLDGRRTGLSAIGLADTFAALNIQYASEKSIKLAEEIYKQFAISAYKSSIDMAKDRGAFPIWRGELEEDNPFIRRIFQELGKKSQDTFIQYDRRNIALLTIPPSGTISLLGKISSGIEPVYQLSYKRRRKVDPNHPNVSFIDKNGDSWEEYNVLHPGFKKWWLKASQWEHDPNKGVYALIDAGEDSIKEVSKESPYHNSTAYELNPLDRIKLQGVIQKWVDHSISSTLNLSKDTTEEQVSSIYMEAWKQGLKGVTIYRDGCRDGVLISNKKDTNMEDFLPMDGIKRPKRLDCDIYYTTSKGIPYNVVIGLYNGNPYEIFATTDIMTKDKLVRGSLLKVARGHYKVNGDINRDKLMENMSQSEKVITRACSGFLRHRTHVKYVVDFLYKTSTDDMQCFNRVIARILKKYIKDEEELTGSTCNNCGSTKLIYKDGCSSCQDCGNSKCG